MPSLEKPIASDSLIIWDAHVHIGRFRDIYFDPVQIALDLISLGVQRWIVSSTTLCEGIDSFYESLKEFDAMESVAQGCAIPFLWVVPEMVNDLECYLDRRFIGLKVHARAHRWSPNGKALQAVARIAAQKNMPLKLHTGGQKRCDAGSYFKLCRNNPDTKFILAHGRPVDQALAVLKECSNVFVDTAFMPIEDVTTLIRYGMSDRILFGSDYPLDQVFYPDQSLKDRYRNSIKELQCIVTENVFSNNLLRCLLTAKPKLHKNPIPLIT